MAITATISVSPSAVQINQKVTCTVTVSNSGSSAVTVVGLRPYANFTGDAKDASTSVAYGTPNLSAGATTSVAASGSTVFPVDVTFFAPSTGILSNTGGTYDMNAFVQTSDGSYVSCTSAALVSVNQITFPTSQQ